MLRLYADGKGTSAKFDNPERRISSAIRGAPEVSGSHVISFIGKSEPPHWNGCIVQQAACHPKERLYPEFTYEEQVPPCGISRVRLLGPERMYEPTDADAQLLAWQRFGILL